MNFNYWYNVIADIPMKDDDGEWFDLETGISYKDCLDAPRERSTLSDKALEARKYAKNFGGKALKGTKKQKEWAEKIRQDILLCVSDDTKILLCRPDGLFSSAKVWIENRDKGPAEFESFVKKQTELLALYNAADNNVDRLNIAKEYNELTDTFGFN